MVACTLLLPQVQSSQFRYNSTCLLLLYCSHRYRVYSKDTRVHACVYLIDPTGTEYTEKILVYKLVNTLLLLHVRSTQYRYKSKCWFVLHCSHRYIVDSTNIRIHVYTSLQVHSAQYTKVFIKIRKIGNIEKIFKYSNKTCFSDHIGNIM